MVKITVEATVNAPLETVWQCWTNPDDIIKWNAASDDWHTVAAKVDLREGGKFSSRMEAKDGSMGFDFEGYYTRIAKHKIIESLFGDRALCVEFSTQSNGIFIRETFDAEEANPIEMQRDGWQAILDNFVKYVETKSSDAV